MKIVCLACLIFCAEVYWVLPLDNLQWQDIKVEADPSAISPKPSIGKGMEINH